MLIDYYPGRNRTHYYPNLDADCPTIALTPSVPDEASFCTRAAFDGAAAYFPDENEVVVYDSYGTWQVTLSGDEDGTEWFYRGDLVPLTVDPPSMSHRMF